jgi:hypothetical protein
MVKKKEGNLRWLGHLFSMQVLDICRKLTPLKPGGNVHVGKPNLRRLESVGEDLKKKGVRNWRHK